MYLFVYGIDLRACLNLFLSMALMSLNIAKLIDLALPMIVILLAQAVVMMLWAYFVTFRTMGKDYDAAVMAAGHCGVGLGQTPNAVANMAAVIDKNGPAPTAWFVLPVVTVLPRIMIEAYLFTSTNIRTLFFFLMCGILIGLTREHRSLEARRG